MAISSDLFQFFVTKISHFLVSEKQLYQKRIKSFLCVMQQKHGDNDKALLMASKFSTESLKTFFFAS
jgi:hypothetical protein